MIKATGLTMHYGPVRALNDVSFEVNRGEVVGFLGPNGDGKSTTMRMCLDLDRADAGAVGIDGQRLVDFPKPMRSVGAVLDVSYLHPTRKDC